MRIILSIAIAIGALYLTIWPHEVGHASMAYLYGCKASWWQTNTSWFLWGRLGGDIDYGCLSARGGAALALTDGAGIIVNLLFLAIAPIIGRWHKLNPVSSSLSHKWFFLATFWWALANYAEAFSYLVLNTLWLKSDMQTVVVESGVSRWLWFTVSLIVAFFIARALRGPAHSAEAIMAASETPGRALQIIFPVYVGVISITMVAARYVFT